MNGFSIAIPRSRPLSPFMTAYFSPLTRIPKVTCRRARSARGRPPPTSSRTACCSASAACGTPRGAACSLSALIALRLAFTSMPNSSAALRPRIWFLIVVGQFGIAVLRAQFVRHLQPRIRSIWLCGLPPQMESVPHRIWSAPAAWIIWPSMCRQTVGLGVRASWLKVPAQLEVDGF